MPAIPGTQISAKIVPFDTNDVYETHREQYGQGGWRSVASLTERDAITTQRRKEGMLVFVVDDDITYQLFGGITNADWRVFSFGSGSNGVFGSISCNTSSQIYTITDSHIIPESIINVSLISPNLSGDIIPQAITNIITGSFDVLLSSIPGTSGYEIHWMAENTSGSTAFNLQNYTLLTVTSALTSNLQSQIDALSAGDLSNYTLLTTTANLTSNLQSQIDSIVQESTSITSTGGTIIVSQSGNNFNIEVASAPIQNHNSLLGLQGGLSGQYFHLNQTQYEGYIDRSEVSSISANLNSQIATLQLSASNHEIRISDLENNRNFMIQGTIPCDILNSKYTITHPYINVSTVQPIISLTVPLSSSVLYVQGITNRTTGSFDVILSDIPDTTGYFINYNISLSGGFELIQSYNLTTYNLSGNNSITLNASIGNCHEVYIFEGILTVNAPINMQNGQELKLSIIYLGNLAFSGLNFDSSYKFENGTSPTITTTGSDLLIKITKFGSRYLAPFTSNIY